MLTDLIRRFYSVLLSFYPTSYQDEFRDEMESVFRSSLADHKSFWWVIWRELRDWPAGVIREHVWVRRKIMAMNREANAGQPQNSLEWVASLLIFLIPVLLPVIQMLGGNNIEVPTWVTVNLRNFILGLLALGLVYGFIKGLPRWVLPYLGFVLMVVLVYGRADRLVFGAYPYFLEIFGPRSSWPLMVRIGYSGIFVLFFTLVISASALVVVNILRVLPFTRRVWQRIRADWTQLSYLLYGGLIFVVYATFDEYRFEEGLKIFLWLVLALSSWLYLRAGDRKSRIRILLGGATVVMWIIAIAKWMLVPHQTWPAGYPESPSVAARWTETIGTVVQWVGFLIILYLPALLDYLPEKKDPDTQMMEGPVKA